MITRLTSFQGILGLLLTVTLAACSSSDKAATGGPSTTGDGGPSGTGGGGGGGPTFPTSGDPLTGPDNTWTWIDFPNTFCRDGSPSGLSVNMNSASKKVMIYLQGGGACFDATTCAVNPANADGQKGQQVGGLFDRTNDKNPVKDWNYVFIPYCTGDIFGGTNENGTIEGLGPQKFVGRKNIEAYLDRIVPTFPHPEHVLLTGISAGGFGAAVSADLFARAFGDVRTTLIDDSGPSMRSQYLPECLQEKWRTLWGFDDSFIKDCGASCPNQNDYSVDYTKFLAKKYPKYASGLIDSNNDSVITLFFGYGQNNCTGGLTTPVPAAQYDAGLKDLRDQLKDSPKFYTYFPASTQHTWLGGNLLYTEAEGGTPLIDWVTAVINDDASAKNVGE